MSAIKDQATSVRHTPANITELGENEIFVFGSNEAGNHAGGVRGVASNSGHGGADIYRLAAAAIFGNNTKAKSCEGGAICLVTHDEDGAVKYARASKVGENGIKADPWYSLDSDGNFVEVPA